MIRAQMLQGLAIAACIVDAMAGSTASVMAAEPTTAIALASIATTAASTGIALSQDEPDSPDVTLGQEEEPDPGLTDAERRRLAQQRQSLNRRRRGASSLRLSGGDTNQATSGIQIPAA